jgi:hypothetical protein
MEDVHQSLKAFINPIHALGEHEWSAFSAHWKAYEASRKTILTASGETEKYLYFVLDGIQRAYYAGADGKEATIVQWHS